MTEPHEGQNRAPAGTGRAHEAQAIIAIVANATARGGRYAPENDIDVSRSRSPNRLGGICGDLVLSDDRSAHHTGTHADRSRAVPRIHRARLRGAVSGFLCRARGRRCVVRRVEGSRDGRRRTRVARHPAHVCRDHVARFGARTRRADDGEGDRRRSPCCAEFRPRRTGRRTTPSPATARSPRNSESSSRARLPLRRACRRASTWRSRWSGGSGATRSPKQSNSVSSTTDSRRTTPVRRPRHRRRSGIWWPPRSADRSGRSGRDGLRQVGDDLGWVFQTNGYAQQAVRDADRRLFLG